MVVRTATAVLAKNFLHSMLMSIVFIALFVNRLNAEKSFFSKKILRVCPRRTRRENLKIECYLELSF